MRADRWWLDARYSVQLRIRCTELVQACKRLAACSSAFIQANGKDHTVVGMKRLVPRGTTVYLRGWRRCSTRRRTLSALHSSSPRLPGGITTVCAARGEVSCATLTA
jgi:hypothetical protein